MKTKKDNTTKIKITRRILKYNRQLKNIEKILRKETRTVVTDQYSLEKIHILSKRCIEYKLLFDKSNAKRDLKEYKNKLNNSYKDIPNEKELTYLNLAYIDISNVIKINNKFKSRYTKFDPFFSDFSDFHNLNIKADILISKADLLKEKQYYKQAIALITKAIEIFNKSSESYYLLSKCYIKMDKVELALENIELAIKLANELISSEKRIDGYESDFIRNYEELLELGETEKARELTFSLLHKSEKLSLTKYYFLYIDILKKTNNSNEKQICAYSELLNIDKSYESICLAKRSELYYMNNKFELAIEDLTKAMVNESDFYYYFTRSELYSRINKLDESLQDLDHTINIIDNYFTYFLKGNFFYESGNYIEALKNYKKSEEFIKIRYKKNMFRINIEDSSQRYILHFLNSNRNKNSYLKEIYSFIVIINEKMNNHSEAARYMFKSIKIDPSNSLYYFAGKLSFNLLKSEQKRKCDRMYKQYSKDKDLILKELNRALNNYQLEYTNIMYFLQRKGFLNKTDKALLIINFISSIYKNYEVNLTEKIDDNKIIELLEILEHDPESTGFALDIVKFLIADLRKESYDIESKLFPKRKNEDFYVGYKIRNSDGTTTEYPIHLNYFSHSFVPEKIKRNEILTDVSNHIIDEINNSGQNIILSALHNLISYYQYNIAKEKEKEIAASKATEGTIAILAHSIKNPAFVMQSQADILSKEIENSELKDKMVGKVIKKTVHERFNMLHQSATEIVDIVQVLRTIQKVDINNDLEFEPKKTVDECYSNLLVMLKEYTGDEYQYKEAKNKEVKFINNLPEKVKIKGELTAVKVLIKDLVLNAMLHAESGTELVINMEDKGSNYELTISNKGHDLPEELKKVYSEQKASDLTEIKTKKHLGSRIIKILADKMKWKTVFEHKDGNNSFTFTIPKA